MCISVFLWQAHPLYPFLLLLNRDEYHNRPTEPLGWWEGGEILGGRDGLAGGTWLACSRAGRVAFLTNVRELESVPEAKSRGDLPVRFLEWKGLSILLEACNSWETVAKLHSQIYKVGLAQDSFFATKLCAFYARYVSLGYARKLFDETPHKTVYLCNATLRSYCREKKWKETLSLFHNMIAYRRTCYESPDNFTVSIALKACAALSALKFGKILHGFIEKNDKIGLDMYVGSALVELYSKCGYMDDALKVFKEFSQPDSVLWTSLVTGYEQNNNPEDSLAVFSQMVEVIGVNIDKVTLVSVVSACAQLSNFSIGRCIHGFAVRRELDADLFLCNSFLDLYDKTGSVKLATSLFRKMLVKDVITWSTMVACYAHNGATVEALDIFNEMVDKGIEPNSVTMANALQACSIACNLQEGRKIHELAIAKGLELHLSVSTALIDMYMKCFVPDKAIDLFKRMPKKDVVAYAALLSGFTHNGMAHNSLGVFCNMLAKGTRPDAVAMVKVLAACSQLRILKQALCFHAYLTKNGFHSNTFVGASLIELYSICGSIDYSIQIFNAMVEKDVIIWSAMIAAYSIHGRAFESLNLFSQMVHNSPVRPNSVTFLSVLSACSHSGLVEEGIYIFNMMLHDYQLKPDSNHYGIMVDLLGRTGELDKAMEIIDQLPITAGPNVWSALLGACRIHNNTKLGELAAKHLFQLDPSHAGYYILLSNIYAENGRWDNVAEMRALIRRKRLKKMFGGSVVEAGSDVHSFDEIQKPSCSSIC